MRHVCDHQVALLFRPAAFLVVRGLKCAYAPAGLERKRQAGDGNR